MKITTDINKNIDFLSNSNKEGEDTSLLSSVFASNFNTEIETRKNSSNDQEYILDDDAIKAIDYLSNILPISSNLSMKNLKKLKTHINLDNNLDHEMKTKINKFLYENAKNNKNLFVKGTKNFDLQEIKNKKSENSLSGSRLITKNTKISTPLDNSKNFKLSNGDKIFNNSNEKNNKVPNSEKVNDKNFIDFKNNNNFVKKIKKNNHPNKLYSSLSSNSLKYRKLNGSSSILETQSIADKNLNYFNSLITEDIKKNKLKEIKSNNQISNLQNLQEASNKTNKYSQQNDLHLSNSNNSMLEGLLETLDLSQRGWTSKLLSRIESALANGGEEIEFNLKPKNLGKLKVSLSLKNGTGNVKIFTENSFATTALTQNENYLQKLFNDQGIDLEFYAHNKDQYFGSKNNFNQNSNNNEKHKFSSSEQEIKNTLNTNNVDDTENDSSRHMVNVIA